MINELVLAASCIANNNISPVDGNPLFDIDKDFDGWKRQWIKDRMKKIYGDKANLPISEQEDKRSVATMPNSSTDADQQKDPTDKTEGWIRELQHRAEILIKEAKHLPAYDTYWNLQSAVEHLEKSIQLPPSPPEGEQK